MGANFRAFRIIDIPRRLMRAVVAFACRKKAEARRHQAWIETIKNQEYLSEQLASLGRSCAMSTDCIGNFTKAMKEAQHMSDEEEQEAIDERRRFAIQRRLAEERAYEEMKGFAERECRADALAEVVKNPFLRILGAGRKRSTIPNRMRFHTAEGGG